MLKGLRLIRSSLRAGPDTGKSTSAISGNNLPRVSGRNKTRTQVIPHITLELFPACP